MVLILCLIILFVNLGNISNQETDPAPIRPEAAGTIEHQIRQLAAEVIGTNESVKKSFVAELLDTYYKSKDADFVVYYSEGGWGSRQLSVNPEGESLVTGVESKLTQLGYKHCAINYLRSEDTLGDYLFEAKEILLGYPVKSKQLAARIDFLIQQIDGLKIIMVGKSTGAVFVNAAAKELANNPDVYTIQLGNPLRDQTSMPDHSLVVNNNGITEDAMIDFNLLSTFKSNTIKMIMVNYIPFFTPVDQLLNRAFCTIWLCNTSLALEIPGHDYMWYYPSVGSAVSEFLVEKFGIE